MEKKRLVIRGRSSKELKTVIARYQQIIVIKNVCIANLKKTIKGLRLASETKQLKTLVKKQEREIERLNEKLTLKQQKVQEVLNRKARVTVKKVRTPLSSEAKRIERIAKNGASDKAVENLEYLTRTATFLKEHDLTLSYFALISRADLLGSLRSNDLGVTYKTLTKLTELDYLAVSTELKGATKYWFTTLKSKQLIKDYKNYLSYSKTI